MRRRVGIHLGCVIATVVALIAIRFGSAAISLGILIRLRVCAAGVPICLLLNVVAGVDAHVGAGRFVGRVEADARLAGDVAVVITRSAVAGVLTARRDFLERDRVGRKRCFCHVTCHLSLPESVCTMCVPIWTAPILGLRAVSAKMPKLMLPVLNGVHPKGCHLTAE